MKTNIPLADRTQALTRSVLQDMLVAGTQTGLTQIEEGIASLGRMLKRHLSSASALPTRA